VNFVTHGNSISRIRAKISWISLFHFIFSASNTRKASPNRRSFLYYHHSFSHLTIIVKQNILQVSGPLEIYEVPFWVVENEAAKVAALLVAV
jgi:hypothetical protein